MDEPSPFPPPLAPEAVVEQAFAALDIRPAHAPSVEAEAAALATEAAARAAIDDPALSDLRALPFLTIDNADSRDLDQALHIESGSDARDGVAWRVRYALADAAHYVRPGSALFAAALARGASHYTPLAVAPMLPRVLSEGLVSLGPDRERRALVFEFDLDRAAGVLGSRVLRARIRSRAQLDYAGVQRWLDERPPAPPDAPPDAPPADPVPAECAETLLLLRTVGSRLAERGRERGVVPFERREATIEVAGAPPRFVARERERLDTEEWNAQISLLCNQEGAALLAALDAHDAPGDAGTLEPIYRVHDAPPPARLRELRERLDEWVSACSLDERFRWGADRSPAEYVAALPSTPREAGRVRAVQRQILAVQRASEFRAEPGRHHALALDGYARFSSPMREIVGIFLHGELLEGLGERAASADTALRDAVIEAANAARRRQKALDKRVALAVIADLLEADLARDPVPRHHGTVLGLREGGRDGGHLQVGIDGLALDLKVYGVDLERRHRTPYRVGALRAVPDDPSRPVFALGDAVTLRAAGRDGARERYLLDLVPRGAAVRRERRRARRG